MRMRKFSFYELDDAEKIYKEGFTGKRLNIRQVYLLLKYLRLKLNLTRTMMDQLLVEYCTQFDPKFDFKKRAVKFERLFMAVYKHHRLVNSAPVIITEAELSAIRSLDNIKLERIMFMILVFVKAYKERQKNPYKKIQNPGIDDPYLDYDHYPQIIKLAGLKLTKEQFDHCIWQLYHLRFLYMFVSTNNSRISLQMKVWIINEESPAAIVVDDFHNIMKFYTPAKKGEK
jgi:hypothetical protein